jgi:hypothetical protein
MFRAFARAAGRPTELCSTTRLGRYAVGGSAPSLPCPAGRFGAIRADSSDCGGLCPPGQYSDAGATGLCSVWCPCVVLLCSEGCPLLYCCAAACDTRVSLLCSCVYEAGCPRAALSCALALCRWCYVGLVFHCGTFLPPFAGCVSPARALCHCFCLLMPLRLPLPTCADVRCSCMQQLHRGVLLPRGGQHQPYHPALPRGVLLPSWHVQLQRPRVSGRVPVPGRLPPRQPVPVPAHHRGAHSIRRHKRYGGTGSAAPLHRRIIFVAGLRTEGVPGTARDRAS